MDTATSPISRAEAALLPELDDGVVALRPLGPEHALAMAEAAAESRDRLSPWLPWCTPQYGPAHAAEFAGSRPEAWVDATEYAFAIFADAPERFVGVCGLNELRPLHHTANLGYWVRSSATGRGYAPAAARLLARFGLLHLPLRRIEIVVAVDNRASCRAAIKSGARHEGTLRNRLYLHGRSHDAEVYSFVPTDFEIADPTPRQLASLDQ
ncbi:GNAT family N-acetyltransferase [Opitutales bacterium ASA1]|uniref:GNAT family N-acetyltransferase n=1 Tax=Congregicoccus parvus TaxID=3081749 RepID=UPI002B2A42B9|nr:GNAT family N-acetyltransferase [Opitutales bacterium ASA1]